MNKPIPAAEFETPKVTTGPLPASRKVYAVPEGAPDLRVPVREIALSDPNEPPLPGKITTDQAWQFAKALAKGQKDRWDIIKTVVENKIREVV